jgi:hypothetical protein
VRLRSTSVWLALEASSALTVWLALESSSASPPHDWKEEKKETLPPLLSHSNYTTVLPLSSYRLQCSLSHPLILLVGRYSVSRTKLPVPSPPHDWKEEKKETLPPLLSRRQLHHYPAPIFLLIAVLPVGFRIKTSNQRTQVWCCLNYSFSICIALYI